jgi:regulator of sigma E protease
VVLPLADGDERFELTKPNKLLTGLGFDFWMPKVPAEVFSVTPGGPADRAGIRPGDLIESADGTPLPEWRNVGKYVREHPGQEIHLTLRRAGREISVRVTPDRERENGKEVGLLKIGGPDAEKFIDYFPKEYVSRVNLGPLEALSAGTLKAWEMTSAQATFFWRMITHRISSDNLTSLITIADYAGQKASEGPASFFLLLVLLSLSLGFMNLLPIPILDGGQIVFQAAEWIRGRPLSDRVYIVGQQAGLIAIVLLMGVALFNDLSTYVFAGAGK